MSFRPERVLEVHNHSHLSFLDGNQSQNTLELFLEVLYSGVHGFCFSIYEDGQKPGDIISYEQVHRRMEILSRHCKAVRSFSCIEGNEWVPRIAKKFGLKTLVGAWLGDDLEKNQQEIDALIELAKEGVVDIAAVGNEVLYRKDLTEEQLLEYIHQVKSAIPNIPVGYVDAYYEFSHRPRLAEVSDVILCNCYPFWEGTPIEQALGHMKSMYHQAKAAAPHKQVIITETGWPSQGAPLRQSVPSEEAAIHYFVNAQLWAADEGIDMYYFSSFDEAWKVGPEGDVGAHWGIWDRSEQLKYVHGKI